MAFKTIRSLLCAEEETREYLWYLFFEHTLLINQLLEELPKKPEFSTWREKGKIPRKSIVAVCNKLKKDESFNTLPARFYTSAVSLVGYTFASIFAIHNNLRLKCEGKQRWLSVAEQDLELAQATNFTSEAIREMAARVLAQAEAERQREFNDREDQSGQLLSVMTLLFKFWKAAKEPLRRRAIAHLLRNDCQVSQEDEDPDVLALRLEKKRKQIQRLQEQLDSHLPIGRDPTGDRTEQFIEEAIAFAEHSAYISTQLWLKWHQLLLDTQPQDATWFDVWFLALIDYRLTTTAEFKAWEQSLSERTANVSTQLKSLPYPLLLGSTDDLGWAWEETQPQKSQPASTQTSDRTAPVRHKPKRCRTHQRKKQARPRIGLSFKGKGLSHLRFRIYCDRRQLPIFQQLVKDWEDNKARKKPDKFSLALSPLRSACLFWAEDPQQLCKNNHWKRNNLWLKWFSQMNRQTIPPEEWRRWFNSFVYLCLSYKLPWRTHRLYLHSTIDPRLLEAEGTEQVRQEKIALMEKFLQGLHNALEEQVTDQMSDEEQVEFLTKQKNRRTTTKKNQTTLTYLRNNPPPPRPSRVAYQGNPEIAVKVAFSREHIVGVAVSDGVQPVIDYRDVESLLIDPRVELLKQRSLKLRNQPERLRKAKLTASKSKAVKSKHPRSKPKISARQLQLQPCRLLKRWRRLQRQNQAERQAEQKHGLYRPSQAESNLAQYINHLLARNIVDLCQRWSAGRIILPEFGDLRESIESEIQAKAKRKYPDDNVERQKQYAKEFRMEFHRWNYGALTQCIRSRAATVGIQCVAGQQPRLGTLREKAIAVSVRPRSPSRVEVQL